MQLDDPSALLRVMLTEEKDPHRRARLVGLQLALGWPRALEVDPRDLADYRAASFPAIAARVWLRVASTVAALWCVAGIGVFGIIALVVPLAGWVCLAFAMGLAHAVVAQVESWLPEPRMLWRLGLPSLLWPALVLVVCGGELTTLAIAAAGIAPSVWACIASHRLYRHLDPVSGHA